MKPITDLDNQSQSAPVMKRGPGRPPGSRGKPSIEGYDTAQETADELAVSIATLVRWRRLRIGPPFTMVGRFPMYNRESKQRWLKSREIKMAREKTARISPTP